MPEHRPGPSGWLADSDGDPLGPARAILIGLACVAPFWLALWLLLR